MNIFSHCPWPSAARTAYSSVIACQLTARSKILISQSSIAPLTGRDYQRRTGPVYQLIWGRNMSPATAAKFAEQVDARILITGHQSQEMGYSVNGERHLILASEHNQGVFLPLDLDIPYEMPELVDRDSQVRRTRCINFAILIIFL